MTTIKNILFPTDFSKYSMAAAEYAVERALKYDATIHLLNVIEDFKPILAIRTFDSDSGKDRKRTS
jgi:nucleotide-binding universal stress UspA family protein